MATLSSIFFGFVSAIAAVLIHLTLPPFGIALALVGTISAQWFIGRRFGKKRYKAWFALTWICVIYKAGSFGVGREILILGDNLGSILFSLGILSVIIGIFTRR